VPDENEMEKDLLEVNGREVRKGFFEFAKGWALDWVNR
jgi:hypothetical protein